MRVIIRVVIEDATEEIALDVRKKIKAVIEKVEGAKVELNMLGD